VLKHVLRQQFADLDPDTVTRAAYPRAPHLGGAREPETGS
jgi:hypothetical protein